MICIFVVFALSDNFPSIKLPKHGIFGWFTSLSHMKKPFNNKNILGFRINISVPDLCMIARDISDHLNLHDLNISGKIADAVYKDKQKRENKKRKANILSSCSSESEYQNVYQLCRLTGIDLNLENLGIPPEHVNIIIGNIAGYFPTGLFLFILAIASIIFYIIQLFLCCFYFRPSERTTPNILSIFLFYAGDILVFIAAILYFCSFTGINSLFQTLISLNTIVPRMTYSIASSFESLTTKGIPNSIAPLIKVSIDICNETKSYFDFTANSFLRPSIVLQKNFVSHNETDPGVFVIYNDKIRPEAAQFYQQAKKYPKLSNISQYFAQQDFSSYQKTIKELLNDELKLADEMKKLNSFFEYLNDTLQPYYRYVANLTYQKAKGSNETIGEKIAKLKEKSIESFQSLSKLNRKSKEKYAFYRSISAIFFIFGIVLLGAPIFLGIFFLKHTTCSICVASTVSIYPLVATIFIFVVAFFFTGIGFADVTLSDQLELAIDEFLTNVVGRTIPTREIVIPPINFTFETDSNYRGILNLSKIIFPDPMHNIEHFVKSNDEDGIAEALLIPSIVKMSNYGEEIGNFIINIGANFSLQRGIVSIINSIGSVLKLFDDFPDTIDGFFNWGIPMTNTANDLRSQIKEYDPSALTELEPYLERIDNYVNLMNSNYQIAKHEFSVELPDALDKIDQRLSDYIRTIMNDLGTTFKNLFDNVYPMLDSIQIGPIIGPYAIIRNFFCYYVASTSAYLSASGTLMMFGLVFVVTLMWIRRKGMLSSDRTYPQEIHCDEDNADDIEDIQDGKGKKANKVIYTSIK
ncbi:hypothetical protein M9Y10_020957 [Tritrichomonas musculus]|uniref:Uncharacterized protein n=1 Tax=Tritrichomonas musculus TaxID=1915356 RepID=A0ABR2HEZ5_9EUKA